MNEKNETQTESGTRSIQRTPKEILQCKIAWCEKEEEKLYASRGYGGYIDTEALQKIREEKAIAIRTVATCSH